MAKISLPGETPKKVKLEKGNLSKDIKSLPIDKQKYFESVLDSALKKIILQGVENFNKSLIAFLDEFTINHTQYEDKKMSDVYRELVIPFFEKNEKANEILKTTNPDSSLYKDNRIVKDVLNLKQKIGENPIFGKEVRDFKNESVLDIAKVTGSLKDTLIGQNIDFEKATKSDWERLINDKIITEDQQINLVKVTEAFRFTGGNSTLTSKLLEKNSLVDIVKYDKDDWKGLIDEAENPEEYASVLVKAAQKKYPSAFFIERKVKRDFPKSALISELNRQTTGSLSKQKLVQEEYGDTTKMAISNYSYMGAKDVIDNPKLGAEVKAEKIEVMQKDMQDFFENTKSIDLRTGDYLSIDLGDNDESKEIFGDKTIAEKVAIRNQALSYQRVTRLAPSFEAQEALLTAGLDSSQKIATQPVSNVRNSLSALNEVEIQNIIGSAQSMFNTAVHTTMSFQGLSSSNYFGLTVLDYPEKMKNSLASIPGYSELFGNQNYCECDHCKSILSPSAYFVDLMKFVDENVYLHEVNEAKGHDIRDLNDIALKNRRPDLWHLELSCENTHKPVSYLSLINKIKISYLYRLLDLGSESVIYEEKEKAVWKELARLPEPAGGSGGGSGSSSSGSSSSSSSSSSASRVAPTPQKGQGNTWKYSFSVSHNQAFEESKVWLEALDLKYLDVLKAFDVTGDKKTKTYLNISDEEWFVLTTLDDNLEDLIKLRFGFPLHLRFNINACPVIELQRATGLDRKEVEQLLKIVSKRFTTVKLKLVPIANTIQEYNEWVEGLNDQGVLDFIHRFVRLWSHMPKWTILELGTAVNLTTTFNESDILELINIYHLQDICNIPFEEALAISLRSKKMSDEKIYKNKIFNAFLNSSVEEDIPSLYEQRYKALLDLPITINVLQGQNKLLKVLQIFGITEAEYSLLLELNNLPGPKFDSESVAKCVRYIFTAKCLGVTLHELFYILKLYDGNSSIISGKVIQLAETLAKLKELPFTINELSFISGIQDDANAKVYSKYKEIDKAEKVNLWFKELTNDKSLFISADEIKRFRSVDVRDSGFSDFTAELNGLIFPDPNADNKYKVKYRSEAIDDSDLGNAVFEENSDFINFFNSNYIRYINQEGVELSRHDQLIKEKLTLLYELPLTQIEYLFNWTSSDVDNPAYSLYQVLFDKITQSGWSESEEVIEYITNSLEPIEKIQNIWTKFQIDDKDLLFTKSNSALIGLNSQFMINNFIGGGAINNYLELHYYFELKNRSIEEKIERKEFENILKSKTDWIANIPPTDPVLLESFLLLRPNISKILKIDTGILDVSIQSLRDIQEVQHSLDVLNDIQKISHVLTSTGLTTDAAITQLRSSDFISAQGYKTELRNFFQSKFDSLEDLDKASEEYLNRIEEHKRDVLCAFIMGMRNINKFDSTSDMYAWFLVDVEMSGCARVSEILAATLSLQLYVHRVIMGLEQHIDGSRMQLGKLDMQDALLKQWEWRKNYRVWEANVRVYIHTENWIEPELRDNKTPLFKTLEDELLQQKITLESAEAAYKEYLKGFEEVGQLAIAGVYFEELSNVPTYHIFGRTTTDPYIYYYRTMKILGRPIENLDEDEENDKTWNSQKSWSPWEKIELTIPSKFVSPIKYNGKLFIFWVTITTLSKSKIESGATVNEGYSHKIDLNYSYLLSSGKWLQPQKIADFFTGAGDPDDNTLYGFNNSLLKNRIYPFIRNNELWVDYLRSNGTNSYLGTFILNTYHNVLTENAPNERDDFTDNDCKWRVLDNAVYIGRAAGSIFSPIKYFLGESNYVYAHYNANSEVQITLQSDATIIAQPLDPLFNRLNQEIRIVQNNDNDYLLKLDEVNYLIRWTLNGENNPKWSFGDNWKIYKKYVEGNREMIRLNTTSIKDLVKIFSKSDIDGFLQISSQQIPEIQPRLNFIDGAKLLPPFNELFSLDWLGSHGLYYQELFFHIPYTIANHLNKEGKYKEADYWYRKIFDPSAKYEPIIGSDRYWQFLQFRNQTVESLLDMLTNRAAIDEYENNPFNPHAIARIRISAYQKNIVMKYIDNIVDWADNLFKMDTWEANTEALMLYMLAKDILGDRPEPLGKCDTAVKEENCGCPEPLTFDAIKNYEGGLEVSEFIHYVDNWIPISSIATEVVIGDSTDLGSISSRESVSRTGLELETSEKTSLNQFSEVYPTELLPMIGSQAMIKKGSNLVFCIPHNEKIFEYWDRVEDRLFKLRNCMNIDGVKRSLALFQPPIDPALLVAAFAAGLSIDDVLNSLYGDLPAYRFTYLIERAKGYAGTVQGMANSLLSALEKKDNEQLTLLRSTQEQNLLKMTKEVKKKAIDDAKANLQSTMEGMINTMNRIIQYGEWIEENLNGWERTQQISLHASSVLLGIEPTLRIMASIAHLVPQVGAPTSMKYGGKEIGDSINDAGDAIGLVAQLAQIVSSSAGLEASFQRRKQDWEFQLKLSEQELKQVQQQIISAQIRLAMAEKDLEIHEKQMDHVKEVHEYYKSKFTNLDLYGFLSKALNTYHRMAYNMAVDMAKQAEAAYKFETGEDTYTGVSGGTFWDSTKAGLLSGEQLTLELQKMEVKYMEWNQRQMEIRQSFSMLMLDPEQLVILKKDGACTFKIPEWAFDLQYPGHYRRRIVSVQLTMPCIVGPYQNVAATLTFINGKLNKLGKEGGTALFPFGGSKMVATSSAQNDGGQFDLNFRDERYLPFEGAGAVESEWRLELPALRSFDYNAIADVIFHISYRSKYDGVFKLKVEDINNPNGLLSRLNTITDSNPLKKLISMKHDFPNEWHLLNQPSNIADMEIELRKENFPYFANVSSIYGIATNAYSLDSNNNLDVNNSHGISFTASTYKVLIPSTFGDGNFKDLMFIVQYKIG